MYLMEIETCFLIVKKKKGNGHCTFKKHLPEPHKGQIWECGELLDKASVLKHTRKVKRTGPKRTLLVLKM
jgi:hypothetical protein